MLVKTLKFDDEVLTVLRAMRWNEDGTLGTITSGQLARKLYEKVNKSLEAMGGQWNRKAGGHTFRTDPRASVEGLLESGSLQVERDGFFETPLALAQHMCAIADLASYHDVLEPSAGLGAIAKVILELGITPDVCEKNEDRAKYLESLDLPIVGRDFLTFGGNTYNRIVMNPPFEEGQDIQHVMHAYDLLEVDGKLVAIMGEGAFFRTDNRATNFRAWLRKVDGKAEKLPPDTFKESGTGVNTRLVTIRR